MRDRDPITDTPDVVGYVTFESLRAQLDELRDKHAPKPLALAMSVECYDLMCQQVQTLEASVWATARHEWMFSGLQIFLKGSGPIEVLYSPREAPWLRNDAPKERG